MDPPKGKLEFATAPQPPTTMSGKPNCLLSVLFLKVKGNYVIDIWDMIFHWIALALVVASCSTPDFVNYWGMPWASSTVFNGQHVASSHVQSQIGLMTWQIRVVAPNLNYLSEWQWINTNCQAVFNAPVGTQSILAPCSHYNSFRACLILGTCCYGLVVLLRTLVFLGKMHEHRMSKCVSAVYHSLLIFFGASSLLLPISNWIMYKLVIQEFNTGGVAVNGASGALLTLGWIIAASTMVFRVIKCWKGKRMDEYYADKKIHEPVV